MPLYGAIVIVLILGAMYLGAAIEYYANLRQRRRNYAARREGRLEALMWQDENWELSIEAFTTLTLGAPTSRILD